MLPVLPEMGELGNMKRIIGFIGLFVLIAGLCHAQTDEVYSANVVGIFKVPVTSGQYNLLSVPMHKIASYRGVISGNATNSITDSTASWTVGEWSEGVTNKESPFASASTFYIEISGPTSSAFYGRHFYIATNSVDMLMLKAPAPSDLQASDLEGASYKIVAALRMRDVFGHNDTTNMCLKAGADPSTADTVLMWAGNGWTDTIFFKEAGPPPSRRGWVQGTNIVDNLVIDRDASLFVRRLGSEPSTNFTMTGEVSGNAQDVILDINYNMIGGMSVVDKVLDNTSLTNVLGVGADPSIAGTILAWNGTGWDTAVFYKDSGPPPSRRGWVQGTNIVGSTFKIEAGKGYFLSLHSATNWSRLSPLE